MKQYQDMKRAQRQGLSILAASQMLGRDRKTVRRYFRMDKEEFLRYLEQMSERGKAFEAYRDEILGIYRDHEGRNVYSAAVYDYLHERHGDLPGSERTLRNYLSWLKASGAIGKGPGREYRPVAPLPYGKQAQIDFGQEQTNIGKAYFVVVVLSRSRYRYVAAQESPFTTTDVIGHLLDAFDFFGGVPEELVLDQDRTMLVAENLGDLATTKAFTDFVAEQGIRLWACRAADPESKGKVENAVKYVKTNFFSSRTFEDFDQLKTQLRSWLGRANGRISQATRLMPLADFEAHERPALRPLRASMFLPAAGESWRETRKVDQKSLVSVGGSRYSVPSQYRGTEVLVERREGMVRAFDPKTGTEIAAHAEASLGGAVVTESGHYRDRAAAAQAIKAELLARLPENGPWAAFVEEIWIKYRRYFREHAHRLGMFLAAQPDPRVLSLALAFCLDKGLSHAQDLIDAYAAQGGVLETKARTAPRFPLERTAVPPVEKRSLDAYRDALNRRASGSEGGQPCASSLNPPASWRPSGSAARRRDWKPSWSARRAKA